MRFRSHILFAWSFVEKLKTIRRQTVLLILLTPGRKPSQQWVNYHRQHHPFLDTFAAYRYNEYLSLYCKIAIKLARQQKTIFG